MKNALKTLTDRVEFILLNYEKARNDDMYLTIALWKNFYPQIVNEDFVLLGQMWELPRESAITRLRANIQNTRGLYLPTDKTIRKKRRIMEEEWSNYLSKKNNGGGTKKHK